jgi:transcriptional regulator with XRE-family HTH domain
MRKPSKTLLQTVSANILRHRKQLKLSQEALADNCGLHRTYIGAVERGERNVSLSSLETIAKALDIEPYELLVST